VCVCDASFAKSCRAFCTQNSGLWPEWIFPLKDVYDAWVRSRKAVTRKFPASNLGSWCDTVFLKRFEIVFLMSKHPRNRGWPGIARSLRWERKRQLGLSVSTLSRYSAAKISFLLPACATAKASEKLAQCFDRKTCSVFRHYLRSAAVKRRTFYARLKAQLTTGALVFAKITPVLPPSTDSVINTAIHVRSTPVT